MKLGSVNELEFAVLVFDIIVKFTMIAGFGNVLGQGLSMPIDRAAQGSGDIEPMRRPITLPGTQMPHSNVGYVGSPGQKVIRL